MAFDGEWGRSVGRRSFLAGTMGLIGGAVLGRAVIEARRVAHPPLALALDPGAPFAFLSTASTPQGTAFSIHVRGGNGAAGMATFNKQQLALLPLDGYLVAVFGAGQSAGDEAEIDAGDYTVHVDMTTPDGSAVSFDLPLTVSTTQFTFDAVTLPPGLMGLLNSDTVAHEAQFLTRLYSAVTPAQLWQGLWIPPVQGPITTYFAEARSYNGGPVVGHHSGVDLAVPLGTPVAACAAGRVAWTGPLSERGNFTAIDHGVGVYSGYAHQSEIGVQVGQVVAQGDIIGKAGSTGLSTGPHVHWECAVNGLNVNALRWTAGLLP